MTKREWTEEEVEWAAECLNAAAAGGSWELGGSIYKDRTRIQARHALDHGYATPPKPVSARDAFARDMERWFPLNQRDKVYWQDAMDVLVNGGWKIEAPTPPPKPKSVLEELVDIAFDHINPQALADAILARFNVTRKETP